MNPGGGPGVVPHGGGIVPHGGGEVLPHMGGGVAQGCEGFLQGAAVDGWHWADWSPSASTKLEKVIVHEFV